MKGLVDHQMAVAVGMRDPKNIEEARQALETYRSLQDELSRGAKVRNVPGMREENNQNDDNRFVTKGELRSLGIICRKTLTRR